jgi:hypothetical protein
VKVSGASTPRQPPWIPDQVRDDGLECGARGPLFRHPWRGIPIPVIPAGTSHSRHPGRNIPFPSSRPEHPIPVIPAGAQRRAGIQRTPVPAPECPAPRSPHGSRIKSGMTGLSAVPAVRSSVTPGGASPFPSSRPEHPIPVIPAGTSHSRHPGRSAAESRDPADACPGPGVSGSPQPPWIPDQVRDDGLECSARGPLFRHPWRGIPIPVIPAGTSHSRHPGRSAAESRDPADACPGPGVSGSPQPPWIPDQVRDDGLECSARGPLFRHPWRGIPIPVIPAGAQRRAGIQRTPVPAPECPAPRSLHGSRIKSGMTGLSAVPEVPSSVTPAGAFPFPSSRPERSGEPGSSRRLPRPQGVRFPQAPVDPGSSPG